METKQKEVKDQDHDMKEDFYYMMRGLWFDLVNTRGIEFESRALNSDDIDIEKKLFVEIEKNFFIRELNCFKTSNVDINDLYNVYLYLKWMQYKMKKPELQKQVDINGLKILIKNLQSVYGIYFGYLIGFEQEHKTSLEDIFDILAIRHDQIIRYISENKINNTRRVSLPIIPYVKNEFKPIMTSSFFELPDNFKYSNFIDKDREKEIEGFRLDEKVFNDENERKFLLQQLVSLFNNYFVCMMLIDFSNLEHDSKLKSRMMFILQSYNKYQNRRSYKKNLVYISFLFFKYLLPFIIRYHDLTDIIKEKIVLVVRAMARNCVYVGHYIGMEQAYNHTTLNEAYYSFENCFLKSKLKRLQRTYSEPIKKLHENEIEERIYIGDTTFKKDVARWNSLFLIDNKQNINAQYSVIENDLDFFDEQSDLFNEFGNMLEDNDYEKGFGRREIGLELDEDFYENRLEAEPVSTEGIEEIQKYGNVNTRREDFVILDYMFFSFNKNFWENE